MIEISPKLARAKVSAAHNAKTRFERAGRYARASRREANASQLNNQNF